MSYLLHTETSGAGQPIILIHGYLASSHYFKYIRKYLESDFTVITIDLLGHGKSPKPPLSYTYRDHIDALRHTITQLGLTEEFTMIGHSMGALIGLRYATLYPEKIKKLVLFNPPMFEDATQAQAELYSSGLRYRLLVFSRLRRHIWRAIRLLPRNPTRTRHPLSVTDMVRVSSAARTGSLHHVIMKGNVFSEVWQITIPTMIIVGKHDRAVYHQNIRATQWPNHVRIVLDLHGHNGLAFYPKTASRYIYDHLASGIIHNHGSKKTRKKAHRTSRS